MSNSHYVSRFLTRPWEHGPRLLSYYDFSTGRIDSNSSESLYSLHGLFSDDIESFSNRYVEDLSAKGREKVMAEGGLLKNFKEYRSLFLLILLQSLRFGALKDGDQEIRKVMAYTEAELDSFVSAAGAMFQFARFNLPQDSRLYVPETGYFVFPVIEPNKLPEWAFGLPLHPRCVLALLPVESDVKAVEKLVEDQRMIIWSVGSQSSKRVVIHPDVLSRNSKEVIIQQITKGRAAVEEQISNMNHLHELIRKAKALV